MRDDPTMSLIRSRQRVADHGEVFTPAWLVEDMLDLVGEDAARIDARVLEPACGAGNFLVAALARKLATVQATHRGNDFARRHYALFALMCLYGIELLADNAAECRENLAEVYDVFLGVAQDDVWARAARAVLATNIVHGNALTMTMPGNRPITFAEWGYLGKGQYQRRDFRYDALTRRSEFEVEGSLFADLGHELFTPAATFPKMTVTDLAGQVSAA
ncbi:MAG: N-6 DNA methylase [Actinomycetales bacterium]|nr:N-6 DNA methylase [Actinomycetales bacterium]